MPESVVSALKHCDLQEVSVFQWLEQSIPVDVRIISATNRNLTKLVDDGVIRKDFYFRINVIPINLPPLRERTEDIPLLAEFFFAKINLKVAKTYRASTMIQWMLW